MAPHLSTKTAAFLALLANGPALAQETGQHAAANTQRIAVADPEAAFIEVAASVVEEGAQATVEPWALPEPVPLEKDEDLLSQFIHKTTEPVMRLVRGSGEWISSGSDAATRAAQNAGQWVAANALGVVAAAKDTGQWISSNSNAAALAVQDASHWVSANATVVMFGQDTSEWITSNAQAAALATQNASQWVATQTDAVVLTVQETGQWVVAYSNAAAAAAQDAGQWITVSTNAVVQDTGDWISSRSSAAANTVLAAASAAAGNLAVMEGWSEGLVKEMENRLRAHESSEFGALVKESGFTLTNIKVEIGLIPGLDAEFRHERDLTPAEMEVFRAKVVAYTSKASGVSGFFEGILLRKLLRAGEYSDTARISDIHINVLPLPALEVFFDPFRYEEQQEKMLDQAYDFAQSGASDLKSLHERLAKIEAMLANPQAKK